MCHRNGASSETFLQELRAVQGCMLTWPLDWGGLAAPPAAAPFARAFSCVSVLLLLLAFSARVLLLQPSFATLGSAFALRLGLGHRLL